MKKIIFLVSLLMFFPGCQTLEETTRFYKITTGTPFPSRPEGTVVPILGKEETRRAYKVIGEMEFQSSSSHFIMDAVQYNARIHGAEAVILEQWEEDAQHYVSWHPGVWSYTYGYGCDNGIVWSNFYSPSYYTSETYVFTKVRAEMVVFLDHDTFGFLGLILEDVRNADFLEVGQVLLGSSAETAGIRPGDRIRKIGAYTCNQGLKHYYEHAPIIPVGQTVNIELERKGKTLTLPLLSQKIDITHLIPTAGRGMFSQALSKNFHLITRRERRVIKNWFLKILNVPGMVRKF